MCAKRNNPAKGSVQPLGAENQSCSAAGSIPDPERVPACGSHEKGLSLDHSKFNENEAEKCCYRGRVYQKGLGTQVDMCQAISWYEKAASFGSADALYRLGKIFSEDNGYGKDEEKAFLYYMNGAKLGHAEAQYKVGEAYFLGHGAPKNVKKGEEFLLRAANAGIVDAQFQLGNLYKNELHEYEKAMHWFQTAHSNGDADAAFHLGLMYEEGLGVNQDWEKAKQLYLDAYIEIHHPFAPYRIGQLYEKGNGHFHADISEAIMWYEEAAKIGIALASLRLGEIYEKGIGGEKDYKKANEYYKKACDAGNQEACIRLLGE